MEICSFRLEINKAQIQAARTRNSLIILLSSWILSCIHHFNTLIHTFVIQMNPHRSLMKNSIKTKNKKQKLQATKTALSLTEQCKIPFTTSVTLLTQIHVLPFLILLWNKAILNSWIWRKIYGHLETISNSIKMKRSLN